MKQLVGALRYGVFLNQADMGNYNLAITRPQDSLRIINSRIQGRLKYGFYLNAEQEIWEGTGVWARGSWNDGNNETWAFTEIDGSFSIGIGGNGSRWKRPFDGWGIANVTNLLSEPHRNYLARGGLGFILGDGRLQYAPENITEVYYAVRIISWFTLSVNYQLVVNPGYNQDRGPANVIGIRARFRFGDGGQTSGVPHIQS